MKSRPFLGLAVAGVVCCSAASVWAAERVWQKGTLRDVQVKRPKVVFGMAPNSPTGAPRTSPPAAREIRSYIIETDTMRLELREDATVDTPPLDLLVGEPVQFAIEKKSVWIKDQSGHEHKLSLVKESKR